MFRWLVVSAMNEARLLSHLFRRGGVLVQVLYRLSLTGYQATSNLSWGMLVFVGGNSNRACAGGFKREHCSLLFNVTARLTFRAAVRWMQILSS